MKCKTPVNRPIFSGLDGQKLLSCLNDDFSDPIGRPHLHRTRFQRLPTYLLFHK